MLSGGGYVPAHKGYGIKPGRGAGRAVGSVAIGVAMGKGLLLGSAWGASWAELLAGVDESGIVSGALLGSGGQRKRARGCLDGAKEKTGPRPYTRAIISVG